MLVFSQCNYAHYSASSDYESQTVQLTFLSSSEVNVSLPIVILSDDVTENLESFTVRLSNASPSMSTVITTPEATVNIIDLEGNRQCL